MDAIKYGTKLQQEKLHLQELGISTLSSIFVNANRDPKKGEPAKPSDFFYFKPQVETEKLDAIACDCFFSLVADGKIPSWAAALAPVEAMRSSRGNGAIPPLRALMGKGVLLLAPRIEGDEIYAAIAIVEEAEGSVQVVDVDSRRKYNLFIPNAKQEAFWAKDWQIHQVENQD